MALDILIDGAAGNKALVDANGNLAVTLPQVEAQAGYATINSEVDDGEVFGSRLMRQPTASVYNRLATGTDTIIWSDYFNAAAQNTALWRSAVTTFTTSQTSGYMVMNASSLTTTAAAAIYQTYRTFSMSGGAPLMVEFSEYRAALPATNQQAEVGLYLANLASTPFTPSDGVYFRFNSNGVFGVLNFAGTETVVQLLTSGQVVINDNTTYRIIIDHYRVEFWGASATSDPRVLLGVIPVPSANGPPFSALSAPFSIRLYNSGTAGSATQLKIANTVVLEMDTQSGEAAPHLMSAMGLSAYQGLNGGTMGSTALLTNSLAAGAGAAMTNTTAALGSGLGGQFAAQPTLAVGTDGILCSYQNPASATGQTGRILVITGVTIQGAVTTALTGGNVLYAYSLAFGHTAVSMATGEAIATKAPRRIALGYENYVVTAAVGALGGGVSRTFLSPITVNPGEFIAIVAKNQGVVTSAGVITFLVTFDGYYQ